ncbi:hypothetical protein ACI2JR_19825 [Klebsiella sp. NPDC088457]
MTSKLTRLTDEELAELAFYAGESTCHPDQNYQIGFESLATGSAVLSIVRELQERRKAEKDSEPAAWTWQHLDQWHVTNDEERARDLAWDCVKVMPLYRHAQPAPASEPVFFIEVEGDDWINAGRIEGKNRPDLVLLPDGINYLYTAPQPAPVVPDAATAIRACLSEFPESVRDIVEECADIAESACRAATLQVGNYPVIPDGYVMVPKEPTAEMIAAAMNCDDVEFNSDETFCVNFDNIYAAMVEAAPQEVKGE